MSTDELIDLICGFTGWDRDQLIEDGFDSYWDYLMPIIEEIEKLNLPIHGKICVYISSNNCSIQGSNLQKHLNGSQSESVFFCDFTEEEKILSCWKAVECFLIWYKKYREKNE